MGYKTTREERKQALAYYYANRDRVLRYQERRRRAAGQEPRTVLTDQQKLARRIRCGDCGEDVQTPSAKLRGRRRCASCQRAKYGNRARENKRRRQMIQERFVALKNTLRCKDCGATQELDFHHRDPLTKVEKVSRLVCRYGWAKVLEEVGKCDVLCRRCHQRRHAA